MSLVIEKDLDFLSDLLESLREKVELAQESTDMVDFNLPNETWCMIFSYLPFKSKKNATATCKLWFRLIRGNEKFSGYILISWHNMEKAIDKLQWNWNWNNWPALKTLELKSHPLKIVGDSRETIQ